MAEFFD